MAHIDQFTPDMLGSAELAEEVNLNGSGKLIKVSEGQNVNTYLTSVILITVGFNVLYCGNYYIEVPISKL